MQTDGHHVALMSEAVSAGARGIVFKHQPVEQFLAAVTAVGSGRVLPLGRARHPSAHLAHHPTRS